MTAMAPKHHWKSITQNAFASREQMGRFVENAVLDLGAGIEWPKPACLSIFEFARVQFALITPETIASTLQKEVDYNLAYAIIRAKNLTQDESAITEIERKLTYSQPRIIGVYERIVDMTGSHPKAQPASFLHRNI